MDEKRESLREALNVEMGSDLITLDSFLPQTLFIVPLQSSPIYPGMISPLVLSKPKLIETVEAANRGIVGLLLTRDEKLPDLSTELSNEATPKDLHPANPIQYDVEKLAKPKDLYWFGTAVHVIKRLNSMEGAVTLLIQGLKRFEVKKIIREEPYLVAQVEYKDDILEKSLELDALTRSVISQVKKFSETNPFFTEELKLAMVNAPGPGALADLVALALSLKKKDAQDFLETIHVRERFEKLLFHLKREQELSEVQKKINEDITQKMQKMQREYFLKEQLRAIRKELGGNTEGGKPTDRYQEKIEKIKLSPEAKKIALEELDKLESTFETSPEYNVIRNYLDWLLSLPWEVFSEDILDLDKARKVLEQEHYGLPKVKDRIIEFLAVRKLKPQSKGSILCFVGPPGVGKTSLGKAIAQAMGRKFFRFSLGGMRDEAEIKGHRRTYIGAMPGKILNAMKRVETQNPVLMLDEVDKLGASFQGDPASALLEVLDPEQNNMFIDHYLDVPFNLSNTLFILTANTTVSIPTPLLDRMEVIEINGYTLEEKQEIAYAHVIPKEIEAHGLKADQLELPKETLKKIMLEYCREPGLRSLQQKVATICRKVATQFVKNPNLKKITLRPKDLYEYLGPESFENELLRRTQTPGVVVGLAWTPMGGQILFVEASDVPKRFTKQSSSHSNGSAKTEDNPKPDFTFGELKLTGQLGDVMTESASIAYSYVKKKTKNNPQAQKFFHENNIHLHVPSGAIPKDGPSAGVTMATALLSLVTGSKAKGKVAMTGELSLVGKVLPVGGIREKVLAARRAGIETVILPSQNKKDLKEIPEKNLKGLEFVFADTIEDVFKAALKV